MAKSAEFILETERKQVLVLEPFGPYYEDAIRRLAEQPDLQTVECSSLREMAVLGRQVGVCVMVAHCPDESHAGEFVDLLRFCRKEFRERKIRIVITVSNDFIFLLPRFIREGANEVLQQPVSPKRLYAKIDRFIDVLPSRDKNGKLIPPQPRKNRTGEDLSDEPMITWQQPLKLRSDCWTTIEGKTHWVSGARKWSVQLVGPPPVYGEWSPCEDFAGPAPAPRESCWEWIPNGLTDDPFIQDEGAWRFRGEKPEFKEGAWIFAGRNPKLAFIQSKTDQGSKVIGAERTLEIAEDSDQGRLAAEKIEEALRQEERVAQESRAAQESPVIDEPELPSDSVEIVSEATSGPAAEGKPAPQYLQRVPVNEENDGLRDTGALTVSPIAAAFLLTELMRDRTLSPSRMLWRFCEHLKAACGYGRIELWLDSAAGWKCLQHEDLMDMSMRQRLEAATRDRIIGIEGSRAAVVWDGEQKLGALVFIGQKAAMYTDFEIECYAKLVSGVLAGIKKDGCAA